MKETVLDEEPFKVVSSKVICRISYDLVHAFC